MSTYKPTNINLMQRLLESAWYKQTLSLISLLLLPLSWLFYCLVWLRRELYKLSILPSYSLPVPVVIVGNITVGGSGKTPLVMSLVRELQQQGWRPGIVTRGYGRNNSKSIKIAQDNSSVAEVGDEAMLLVTSKAPLVVGADRVAAAKLLLANSDCDILVLDDGLQHYRLQRDIEIIVVDGARRFGNQQMLPAGPLREPVARLPQADFVVINGKANNDEVTMQLTADKLEPVNTVSYPAPTPAKQVHAVAGIGNPQRFFNTLRSLEFEIIEHEFPDHHAFTQADLEFGDQLPIIMTEKDAVKCKAFNLPNHWYLPVIAKLNLSPIIKQLANVRQELPNS